MQRAEPHFCLTETDVAQKTGLTPDEIQKRRGPAGERWIKKNGRMIWSALGVLSLEEELATEAHTKAALEAPQEPALEAFLVARIRNPRALHIVRKGQAYESLRPLWLWLPQPKSFLFRPGMEVLGTPRPGQSHVWDFAGNPQSPEKGRRMPRRPGQW
jgi:hypothetical protein